MITASLSPVGSHTMEWTSPPILEQHRSPKSGSRDPPGVPSSEEQLPGGARTPLCPLGAPARPTSPPHRGSRRLSRTGLPRSRLFWSLPLGPASPLKGINPHSINPTGFPRLSLIYPFLRAAVLVSQEWLGWRTRDSKHRDPRAGPGPSGVSLKSL